MLNIGWSELLVVAIVAIVVVGPKDLPKLMRTFGFYAGKIRRAAADFQRQFEAAVAESEADEVRKNIEAIRANMGTAEEWSAGLNKQVMTGEPPRTALGAPPLDTQQAEEPTRKRAQAKKAAKTARSKAGAPKSAAPRKDKVKPAAKPAAKKPKTSTKATR